MSINWVMLDTGGKGFVPLPRERVLYTSPDRTAIAITTPNTYPGKQPLNLTSSTGVAYLTSQRLVYLPTKSTPLFQSFSSPILNLLDTHVTAPFFGPNAWTGIVKPVTGGNIPPHHAYVEVKLTFKDGGAYDFQTHLEQLKERLSQAVESAREVGRAADLSNVPLEELPAYEEARDGRPIPQPQDVEPAIIAPTPLRPGQAPPTHPTQSAPTNESLPVTSTSSDQQAPPDEPPPAYEDAQSSSVRDSLEESLRRELTH